MATAHEAAANAPNAGEYVVHHLTQLNTSGHAQTSIIDFSIINLDSVSLSVLMGVLGLFFMWRLAKKATSGVPGRAPAAQKLLIILRIQNPEKNLQLSPNGKSFVRVL